MTKRTTRARKEQARRARLRDLMPGAAEDVIGRLAAIDDPFERLGAAIEHAYLLDRPYDPNLKIATSWLARLDEARRQLVACNGEPAVGLAAVTHQIGDARGEGAPPETITRLERRRLHLLLGYHGNYADAGAAIYATAPDQPDDRHHRPRHIDPVLRGAARATGQTATAVRRGHTVTDWQHDEREDRR